MKNHYNRRSFPRRNVQYPVHVDAQTNGAEFGQILDVSLEGIRMRCCETVKRGEQYELTLQLPKEIGHGGKLRFEARSIWTTPDKHPGYCLSGFKLVSFDEDSHQYLALSSAITEYEDYLSNTY